MHADCRGMLAAVLLASSVLGCGGSITHDRDAAVAVTVNALGTQVATIVITVEAADIATPPVFNLTLVNGTAAGTLRMPPGVDRTLTARAFESDGTISHEGSVVIPVVSRGQNPPVSIPMVPRSGQQPVTIVIGAVSVLVLPGSATVAAGSTLQLAAEVRAADGQLLVVDPEWATSDPTVLTVSSAGLVSALRQGQADVVATYGGTAGMSRVTVGDVQIVACGNGVVEAGEACDDGGIISGDGCSSTCAVEPGWICTGQPSACGATSVCGDGVLASGEECDDGNAVAGDGCSPACTFDGPFATPGSVLVTEVLANPGVVSDAAGEWIELYNATLETLELAGCRIGDNAGGFTIPALAIAPGEYAVAGINGDPLLNGGVTLDLVYTGVFLSNGADHVTLSCGSTVLSSVSWDLIDVPVNGVARQQDPGTFGADPGTWCNATMPFGAGDLGTPGAANVVCAAP